MRLKMCCLFVGLLLGLATPAFSQEFMKVRVPFDFKVGSQAYPAGNYVVTTQNLITYRLACAETKKSVAIVTEQVESPIQAHSSSLVFANVGGQYHLMEIWYDQHLGHAAPEASSLRKQVIASNAKVEVLASLR